METLNLEVTEVTEERHDLAVSEGELQRIVQAAYDRYGVLAEPSYDLEAGLSPAEQVLADVERAHNVGVRA